MNRRRAKLLAAIGLVAGAVGLRRFRQRRSTRKEEAQSAMESAKSEAEQAAEHAVAAVDHARTAGEKAVEHTRDEIGVDGGGRARDDHTGEADRFQRARKRLVGP